MANFEYGVGIVGDRDAVLEARLEAISAEEAAKIAALAGLTDVGADGDWDVADDAAYAELTVQAISLWRKKLK